MASAPINAAAREMRSFSIGNFFSTGTVDVDGAKGYSIKYAGWAWIFKCTIFTACYTFFTSRPGLLADPSLWYEYPIIW